MIGEIKRIEEQPNSYGYYARNNDIVIKPEAQPDDSKTPVFTLKLLNRHDITATASHIKLIHLFTDSNNYEEKWMVLLPRVTLALPPNEPLEITFVGSVRRSQGQLHFSKFAQCQTCCIHLADDESSGMKDMIAAAFEGLF